MNSDKQSAQCPRCKSSDIYRTKKNKLENLRNHIQPIKVFECLYCNYRFTVPAEKESGKKPGKLRLIVVALLLGLGFVAMYLALQPQNKSAGYQQTLKDEEPSAGTKTDDGRNSDVQKEALALLNTQWTRKEAVENTPPDRAQIRITPPPAALELAVLDRNTDKAGRQQQHDARMAELEQKEKAIMAKIETLQAQAAEQENKQLEQSQKIQHELSVKLAAMNENVESAQQQIQQRDTRINELAQQEKAIMNRIETLQAQAAEQKTREFEQSQKSQYELSVKLAAMNENVESARQQIQQRETRINELVQQEKAIMSKIETLQAQAAEQKNRELEQSQKIQQELSIKLAALNEDVGTTQHQILQRDTRINELAQQEKAIMKRIEALQVQAAEQNTRKIEQMQGIQREHDSRLATLNKNLESAQQQTQQRNARINELAQQEQAILAKIAALQFQAEVQETQPTSGTTQSRKRPSAGAGVPTAIHGEDYTIQIASVASEAEVGRLIASLDRKAGVTEPFYYYLSRKQSNDWYPVLYGVFSSRKAALNALAKLPQALKSHDPMVRQIKNNSAPMIRY